MTPALDPALGLALRAALAGVLVAAARHKLREPARFRAALAGYALLPARALGAAAALVPAAELALGAALILPDLGPAPAFGAAALLALYAGAVASALARGRRAIDCGCGARPQPIHGGLVARNAVLVAAALAAALPAHARALAWPDALTVAGGAAVLWLLCAAADTALENGARWRALSSGRA